MTKRVRDRAGLMKQKKKLQSCFYPHFSLYETCKDCLIFNIFAYSFQYMAFSLSSLGFKEKNSHFSYLHKPLKQHQLILHHQRRFLLHIRKVHHLDRHELVLCVVWKYRRVVPEPYNGIACLKDKLLKLSVASLF